jgi:NAD+ kinase
MAATRFPRIALVGRRSTPAIAAPIAELGTLLAARGHGIVLDAETAEYAAVPGAGTVAAAELGKHADLAIVIGGDGTMLALGRQLAPFDVPLIGVNQGRLGFLTDISLAGMTETLTAMLEGRYVEQRRTLLSVTVERAGGAREDALALNDVVVNRGSLGSMIECAVSIDGRFAYAMRADGIIVATPTGSTAYALSAGGPILSPQLASFLLVPVAPHALTNRPIAVGDAATITVTLLRGGDAWAHCDAQAHFQLQEGDRVTIRCARHKVRLLHPEGHDHFAMLRQKLHWSETPERLRP